MLSGNRAAVDLSALPVDPNGWTLGQRTLDMDEPVRGGTMPATLARVPTPGEPAMVRGTLAEAWLQEWSQPFTARRLAHFSRVSPGGV